MAELKELTDQQVDEKLKELQSVDELSDDQRKEVEGLKEERQTRYQKRIDQLTAKAKTAEEKAEALELQLEEQRRKKEEEAKVQETPRVIEEAVTIGNKKFYTDAALQSMVNSGELSSADAYVHQQQRYKAEIKQEILEEQKQVSEKQKAQEIFDKDREWVNKNYPHFNKKHPDFDPNDELYKLSSELYDESYHAKANGLSLAIKRAKQILRVSDDNPDISDDLSVMPSKPTGSNFKPQKTEDELTDFEKEQAIRTFVMSSAINPKTGRVYTEAEALERAKRAKNGRKAGR